MSQRAPRATTILPGIRRVSQFGVHFLVASVDDIIRSKESTGRAKDEDDVLLLKELKRLQK
ncbi:MAG: hypothetical protein DMD63_05780 [Gemmatimonadetes bacterium]|nr:MAG: hypothetical protein DMD63_05780 [Gemmatimonadota bacterium]